ncbi:hypothetical protein D3C75_158920 [compost metagenome]
MEDFDKENVRVEQCCVCGDDVEVDKYKQYDIVTCERTKCIATVQKQMGGVN